MMHDSKNVPMTVLAFCLVAFALSCGEEGLVDVCAPGEIDVDGSCTALCIGDANCPRGFICQNELCVIGELWRYCGDGVVDPDEECDDQGESTSCNADCTLATCADPVDGSWSHWSSWSDCSASCGDGTQTRVRTCTNPSPSCGGAICSGLDVESRACSSQGCCVSEQGESCDNGHFQEVSGCATDYGCATFWGIYYNSPNGCDAATAGSSVEYNGPTCTYVGFAYYDPFHNTPDGSCIDSTAQGYSSPNTFSIVIPGSGCTTTEWLSVPGTVQCDGSCL